MTNDLEAGRWPDVVAPCALLWIRWRWGCLYAKAVGRHSQGHLPQPWRPTCSCLLVSYMRSYDGLMVSRKLYDIHPIRQLHRDCLPQPS